MIDLQRAVNSISYPPNHAYNVTTMEPIGKAAKDRFAYLIPQIEPLVKDKVVLDVGCNKGFFTIWCAEKGAVKVVGQDINEHYVQLVREIAQWKGLSNVVCTTVPISRIGETWLAGGLPVTKEGDVALVLGVGHYLTYESGLEWLYRLYYLGYDVLMEWPCGDTDPSVKVHRRTWAGVKTDLLNEKSLREKVAGLYDLEFRGRSPDLGRPLYFLKKIPLPEMCFEDTRAGPLFKKRGTSRIYMRGKSEVVILKPIHRSQGARIGYARRWVRGQQILSKEFPGIVPKVSALVVGKDGVVDGLAEERLDCQGDRNLGSKRLFDVQIFLVKRSLIIVDFHISDVVGEGVVDLDGIEVLNKETDLLFRKRVAALWREHDPPWGRGVRMEAVEGFARLVKSPRPLLEILERGREVRYFE